MDGDDSEDEEDSEEDGSDEDEEDEEDEEDGSDDDDGSEDGDSEDEEHTAQGHSARWKEDIAARAAAAFQSRYAAMQCVSLASLTKGYRIVVPSHCL